MSDPLHVADWREWSYEKWNRALIDYCLRSGEPAEPVERLAATPEELAYMVGASAEEADEAARLFVEACCRNIPPGRSFFGYCGSALGRKRASDPPWTSQSQDAPYFFAMLWFTCLVAYGYPDAIGSFSDRFSRLIGNRDNLEELPQLWWEVYEWTYRRNEAGDPIRILALPPKDGFRKRIGESHFLAFPHKHDRRQIARVLIDAEMVGYEPPIRPVLAEIEKSRKRFSSAFCQDLDHFITVFIDTGTDPRASAFWRAIRQEALQPSDTDHSTRYRIASTSILAVFDDDGLLPLLGCKADWTPPDGYILLPLDDPIGDLACYVATEDGGVDSVWEAIFDATELLGPGPRALLRQGVLVFQEDQSDEYYLVSGRDVEGAKMAVVRDDLLDAFRREYGGIAHATRIAGWTQVEDCEVIPFDDPPAGLETVVYLQRTMARPSLRAVGGIPLSRGYLGIEGFLPKLRAPGATSLIVTDMNGGRKSACIRGSDGEWSLPPGILESTPTTRVQVVASWGSDRAGDRPIQMCLQFSQAVFNDEFKPLGAGHYFMEGCRPGQQQLVGGEPIRLALSGLDDSRSVDLIEHDPSARFMGPGFGELSTSPESGFDWLAVGPKNAPEMLVYVGDPGRPAEPHGRRSPSKGDRRHWRCAFAKSRSAWVRTAGGEYRELEEYPELDRLRTRFIKHAAPPDAERCPATELETLDANPPNRVHPVDAIPTFADALAALSTRRSGLRYHTVQQLIRDLFGLDDFGLHHEIIRAWTEAGALDLVRSQSYSSTFLVARMPRFVAVHRGPLVDATLIGLVTRLQAAQIERLARELGATLHEVQPGCPWQPVTYRVRAEEHIVRRFGQEANLPSMEWLVWPRGSELPDHLQVEVDQQDLWDGRPPYGYVTTMTWDWTSHEFRRGDPSDHARVRLEQRAQKDSGSIYVVLVGGEPWLWTYIRNWALLFGYELAGIPPFQIDRRGWLTTSGRSPVHLPVPLGRICTILGDGLPGPTLDQSNQRITGYCYPFGRRLTQLISQVVPASWLDNGEN